jgi:hypothetical protein
MSEQIRGWFDIHHVVERCDVGNRKYIMRIFYFVEK